VACRRGESYRKYTELAEGVDGLIRSIQMCQGSKLKSEDILFRQAMPTMGALSGLPPIDP
jgi:hypothetical protein